MVGHTEDMNAQLQVGHLIFFFFFQCKMNVGALTFADEYKFYNQ